MNQKQYNAILRRLDWSQIQAAHELGINERTSRRYALGECPVPEPTAKLLKMRLKEKEDGRAN